MKNSEHQLRTSLWVPLDRSDVFESFSDAANLESLTPPFLHFSVTTPMPIDMKRGQLIDYRLWLHGLPIRWRTEITNWEPPFRFEDSQLRGPYSLWVHAHTFEELNGGTLVRDVVRYAAPGGAIVHRLFVKPNLMRIFKFRQSRLPELLGVDPDSCDPGGIQIARAAERCGVDTQSETADHHAR